MGHGEVRARFFRMQSLARRTDFAPNTRKDKFSETFDRYEVGHFSREQQFAHREFGPGIHVGTKPVGIRG